MANDCVPNFLFQNQGNGIFKESGMWAGVAVNGAGRPEAGMGTDMADYNEDGLLDIFVTNLDMGTNTLYRNTGQEMFLDVTFESGHGERSLRYVAFGTAFFDYENDGDLDIFVINLNDLPTLLRNDGGNRNHWLSLRLVGTRSNREAIIVRIPILYGSLLTEVGPAELDFSPHGVMMALLQAKEWPDNLRYHLGRL